MRMALSLFYRQCEVVLSPSPAADDSLASLGVDRDRIGRWARGVDLALYDPAKGEPDAYPGEIKVLYAGRLTKEKGVDLLADVLPARPRARPAPAPAARRRRPRGGRASRAARRARHLPRLARSRAARARVRERRPVPLLLAHRHLRPGDRRGAGERPAGGRGRRGRPGLADPRSPLGLAGRARRRRDRLGRRPARGLALPARAALALGPGRGPRPHLGGGVRAARRRLRPRDRARRAHGRAGARRRPGRPGADRARGL